MKKVVRGKGWLFNSVYKPPRSQYVIHQEALIKDKAEEEYKRTREMALKNKDINRQNRNEQMHRRDLQKKQDFARHRYQLKKENQQKVAERNAEYQRQQQFPNVMRNRFNGLKEELNYKASRFFRGGDETLKKKVSKKPKKVVNRKPKKVVNHKKTTKNSGL
jgi:hypothetical protein